MKVLRREITGRHRNTMSCRLQGMKSCHMLFDSSKKGKRCSDKPIAQKLIWSWKGQCSSVIEDDISSSMLCKDIVSSGERTFIGEGMWIINIPCYSLSAWRLKPTCQDSKIYLQDLQTNWIVFAVLLYFMLWKIEAFLWLLLLLVTIQKTPEVEIHVRQKKNLLERKRGERGGRKRKRSPAWGNPANTLPTPPSNNKV